MCVTSSRSGSRRQALQASTFAFAHPAPHPIAFVPSQRVVEALHADGALGADPFRLAGRAALLGEEDLGVVVSASRAVLPWNEMVHGLSPELHSCNSGPYRTRNASRRCQFLGNLSLAPSLRGIVARGSCTCKPRSPFSCR